MRSSFIVAAASGCSTVTLLLLSLLLSLLTEALIAGGSHVEQPYYRQQPSSASGEAIGSPALAVKLSSSSSSSPLASLSSSPEDEEASEVAINSDAGLQQPNSHIIPEAETPDYNGQQTSWQTIENQNRHLPPTWQEQHPYNQYAHKAKQTKTYERIVLEGTRVRIGCPHVSTSFLSHQTSDILSQPPATIASSTNSGDSGSGSSSHTTKWHYRLHKKRKQFTSTGNGDYVGDSNELSTSMEERDEEHRQLNNKRVKWFRNHVPIVNLNDSPPSPSSSSYGDLTETLSDEQPETEAKTLDPNKTTELSKAFASRLGSPNLDSDFTEEDLTSWHEVGRFKSSQDDGNELAEERKLVDLNSVDPNGAQWHINKFGELVTDRVSKYLAGRYTCLADGRQTEVLLDVLPISGTGQQHEVQNQDSGQMRLRKRDRWARASDDVAHLEITKESGFSVGDRFDDVDSPSSSVTASNLAAESQVGWNFDAPRLAKPHNSLDLNGFQNDGQAAHSLLRQRVSSGPAIQHARGNHRAQHTQIHLVDSETVRAEDLKLIPGFLYTRQQLICPVSSFGTALSVDQIDSLSRGLCPMSLISNSSSKSQDADREACELLANRLTSWLVNSRHLFNCSSWPLELVWFKDGVKLEFDSASGRVSNSDLDIKLTDSTSLDPDNVGYTSSKRVRPGNSIRQTKQQLQRDFQAASGGSGPKLLSMPTAVTTTATIPQVKSPKQGMCFRRGRVLVIDGVQRDSAGYYTCALQLSVAKLERIIQRLQEQMNSNERDTATTNREKYPLETRQAANGIRLFAVADENKTPKSASPENQAELSESLVADQFHTETSAIKTIEFNTSGGSGNNPEDEMEHELRILVDDGDSMMKRIALMKLVLADRFASKQSLATVKRLLSSLENPVATMQTFSLVVASRAADSCDLWSTVLEADNAYTTRKLADFKRLKSNRDLAGRDSLDVAGKLSISRPSGLANSGGKKGEQQVSQEQGEMNPNAQLQSSDSSAQHQAARASPHHYRRLLSAHHSHAYASENLVEPIKSSHPNYLSGSSDDHGHDENDEQGAGLRTEGAEDDEANGSSGPHWASSEREEWRNSRAQMSVRRFRRSIEKLAMDRNDHLETSRRSLPSSLEGTDGRVNRSGNRVRGQHEQELKGLYPRKRRRGRNQISSQGRRLRRRIDGEAEEGGRPTTVTATTTTATSFQPNGSSSKSPLVGYELSLAPILLLNNADNNKQLHVGSNSVSNVAATDSSNPMVVGGGDRKPEEANSNQEKKTRVAPFNYANEVTFEPSVYGTNRLASAPGGHFKETNDGKERPHGITGNPSMFWTPEATKLYPLTSETSGMGVVKFSEEKESGTNGWKTKDLITRNQVGARKCDNASRTPGSSSDKRAATDRVALAMGTKSTSASGDTEEAIRTLSSNPAPTTWRDHPQNGQPAAVIDVGSAEREQQTEDNVATMLSKIDDKLPPSHWPLAGWTGNDGVGAKMNLLAIEADGQRRALASKQDKLVSTSGTTLGKLTLATDSLLLPITFDVPQTRAAEASFSARGTVSTKTTSGAWNGQIKKGQVGKWAESAIATAAADTTTTTWLPSGQVSENIAYDDPWQGYKLLPLKTSPVSGGMVVGGSAQQARGYGTIANAGTRLVEAPSSQRSSGEKTSNTSTDKSQQKKSSIDNPASGYQAQVASDAHRGGGGRRADKSTGLIRKQRQLAWTGQVDDNENGDADDSSEDTELATGAGDDLSSQIYGPNKMIIRSRRSEAIVRQPSGYSAMTYDKNVANSPADTTTTSSPMTLLSQGPVSATTTTTSGSGVGDDETLLWQAGQYLYMHMRALAASSIYGVQVDVEWSNERMNTSETDLQQQQQTPQQKEQQTFQSSPEVGAYSSYLSLRDVSPFAVIDVISGQNLHLQCTAQAFGRLPEVAWYKRIDSLPGRLAEFGNKTRRIGNDLYWPLTEIDALGERDDGVFDSIPFVCSQSTTIFDNLVNQTFTVVQKLQLSQYNDSSHLKTVNEGNSGTKRGVGEDVNLYACVVDADVRHNYATLGVHFREAPSRIPLDVSKRLQAQSAFFNHDSSPLANDGFVPIQPEVNNFGANGYNMFRENPYHVPMKSSYWIPLQNKTLMDESLLNTNNLTPTMLTIIIGFVSVSLLGLVYLTMRSYQSLTHLQSEQDIDLATYSSAANEDDEHEMAAEILNVSRIQVYLQKGCQVTTTSGYDVIKESTTHTGCSCLLDSLGPEVDYSDAGAIELTSYAPSGDSCEMDLYNDSQQTADTFYDSHLDQSQSSVFTPIVSTEPQHSPPSTIASPYQDAHLFDSTMPQQSNVSNYKETIFECCQQELYNEQIPVKLIATSALPPINQRINMIQNPIDDDDDDLNESTAVAPAAQVTIQKQQVVVTRFLESPPGCEPTEL